MHLNDEQLEAITLDKRNPSFGDRPRYAIQAGAGSGKTRVLIAKAIEFLGIYAPDELLLLTFTRAAAEEMQTRLKNELRNAGIRWPELPQVTTIHAWCAAHIRANDPTYFEGMTIYDPVDQEAVLRGVARDLGMPRAETARVQTLRNDRFVHRGYRQRMTAARAIDYDMLEERALELLRKPFQADLPYRAILVDEAQDLSHLEGDLLDALAVASRNGCQSWWVGDARQSIYQWRDADPEVWARFFAWDNARNAFLHANHRSASSLVHLTSSFAEEMGDVLHPRQRAYRDDEGTFELVGTDDEAGEIARRIVLDDHRGVDLADIAVLTRTWNGARAVARQLAEFKVPYLVCQPTPTVWDSPFGRYIAAVLRLANNPHDDELAFSIAQAVCPGSMTGCRVQAKERRTRIIDCWPGRLHPLQTLLTADPEEVDHDIVRIVAIAAAVHPTVASDLDYTLERMGVYPMRWSSVASWCGWWAFGRSVQDRVTREPRVHIMTMHGSKGLEFKRVYVMGGRMEQRTDEEQRLLYVAMTRAKDDLVVTWRQADREGRELPMPALIDRVRRSSEA